MDIEIQFGQYRIEQGDANPCEFPEKLWLFNESDGGMEIRSAAIESILDDYFKQNF